MSADQVLSAGLRLMGALLVVAGIGGLHAIWTGWGSVVTLNERALAVVCAPLFGVLVVLGAALAVFGVERLTGMRGEP